MNAESIQGTTSPLKSSLIGGKNDTRASANTHVEERMMNKKRWEQKWRDTKEFNLGHWFENIGHVYHS